MCIRDREYGAVPPPPTPTKLSETPPQIAWSAPAFAVHCACLLYTSDAADERSSVDLGGRRIIKKKKTSVAKR